MYTVAVRGAVQLERDDAGEMTEAVQELVRTVMEQNKLAEPEIISIQFSQTADITAENPARALRRGGYGQIPLFCSQEPSYPGSLPRTVRVLILADRKTPDRMQPVYIGGAQVLRPDLVRD